VLGKRLKSLFLAIGVVAAVAVFAAGCGSSGGSTGGDTAVGSKSGAEGDDGAAVPNKVYAPGVPSLEEFAQAPAEEKLPTGGPPAAKGVSVVNVSCGEEDAGCKDFTTGITEAAEAIGWKITTIDGRNNENNGWSRATREAIVQNPDVIVQKGVNCPEILQPLEEAHSAGIPVLSAVGSLDCDAKVYGTGEASLFIPFEALAAAKSGEEYNLEWGRHQAGTVIDQTKGEAKVITAPYEAASGELVEQGWKEELEKCPGCEIVGEVPWNATELVNGTMAKNMETALLRYPEANAVLSQFDVTDEVLAKPVLDAGRAASTPVMGGEAGASVQALIREEKGYSGTAGAIDLTQMGWAAIDTINRYLRHQPTVPEAVGFGLVDSEHLSPGEGGYLSPLNYKAAYEKIWGVE
jgi:ribose transport system substrate-binding protein